MAKRRGHGEGVNLSTRERRPLGVRGQSRLAGRQAQDGNTSTVRRVRRSPKNSPRSSDKQQRGLPIETDRLTLEQFLNRWLEEEVKPNREPGTYTQYANTVSASTSFPTSARSNWPNSPRNTSGRSSPARKRRRLAATPPLHQDHPGDRAQPGREVGVGRRATSPRWSTRRRLKSKRKHPGRVKRRCAF